MPTPKPAASSSSSQIWLPFSEVFLPPHGSGELSCAASGGDTRRDVSTPPFSSHLGEATTMSPAIISLIIQLVSGAAGGNVIGAVLKKLPVDKILATVLGAIGFLRSCGAAGHGRHCPAAAR